MLRNCLIACALLLYSGHAYAFFSQSSDTFSQEARGMFYGSVGKVDAETAGELSARLMYNADMNTWHAEYHQVWGERFATENTYQTRADRLNISFSGEKLYAKLGRQAVNLATTFYFSPNDFFAPFSVQTFNRDYKTGVDALYAEYQLAELSTLSTVLVNSTEDSLPTSSVVRFESPFEDMAWMLMAGEIHSLTPANPVTMMQFEQKQTVIGGSIQTDLWDTIGVRAEGHRSKANGITTSEWVLGLEYNVVSDFTVSMEWFHHGAKAPTFNLPYTAGQYLALGASATITPLLSASFSGIFNRDDNSQLYSAYLNYSLSNDSTLSLYALQPSEKSTTTEFGNYLPVTGLELFIYF